MPLPDAGASRQIAAIFWSKARNTLLDIPAGEAVWSNALPLPFPANWLWGLQASASRFAPRAYSGLGRSFVPRAAVGLSCVPSFRLRDLTGDRLSEGGGLDLFSCHHGSYRALSGVSLGPLWDFMPLFHRRHAGQGFSAGCRSETCMGAFAALLLHCLITTLNPFSEAKKNAVERNS